MLQTTSDAQASAIRAEHLEVESDAPKSAMDISFLYCANQVDTCCNGASTSLLKLMQYTMSKRMAALYCHDNHRSSCLPPLDHNNLICRSASCELLMSIPCQEKRLQAIYQRISSCCLAGCHGIMTKIEDESSRLNVHFVSYDIQQQRLFT